MLFRSCPKCHHFYEIFQTPPLSGRPLEAKSCVCFAAIPPSPLVLLGYLTLTGEALRDKRAFKTTAATLIRAWLLLFLCWQYQCLIYYELLLFLSVCEDAVFLKDQRRRRGRPLRHRERPCGISGKSFYFSSLFYYYFFVLFIKIPVIIDGYFMILLIYFPANCVCFAAIPTPPLLRSTSP